MPGGYYERRSTRQTLDSEAEPMEIAENEIRQARQARQIP